MTKKSAQLLRHSIIDGRFFCGSISVQVLSQWVQFLWMSWQEYVFVGFVLAFDRLAKASTFVFNAQSSNCISEVSCSLSSWSLVVQVRDQLVQAMRNSDPRVRSVLVFRLNSNFHSTFTLQVAGCDFQYRSNLSVPLESILFWVR